MCIRDSTLVQTDDWGENINGVRVGTWTIDAKNVPVTITGTIRLAPVDAGCTNTIDAHIKSSIPLVGGKIEGVVGKGTEKTICLLYTSDAADDLTRVDLGGR